MALLWSWYFIFRHQPQCESALSVWSFAKKHKLTLSEALSMSAHKSKGSCVSNECLQASQQLCPCKTNDITADLVSCPVKDSLRAFVDLVWCLLLWLKNGCRLPAEGGVTVYSCSHKTSEKRSKSTLGFRCDSFSHAGMTSSSWWLKFTNVYLFPVFMLTYKREDVFLLMLFQKCWTITFKPAITHFWSTWGKCKQAVNTTNTF